MRLPEFSLVACLLAAASAARAEVVEFTDWDQWAETAGSFNTIDFTGFPDVTPITDEYAELGVLFADESHFIACCSEITFPNDGAGLDAIYWIHPTFLTPQSSIAADFRGSLEIQLFCGGSLVYTSSEFSANNHGFAGVVTDELFDSVLMVTVDIDDLYFGGPIDAGDLDGDGATGFADFLLLLEAWGPCPVVPEPCPADIDHDGMVGVTDFLLLLSNWS